MAKLFQTSIQKLDQYLGGGVPEQKVVLFSSLPDVNFRAFMAQIFHNMVKNGASGIIFVTSMLPSIVREFFKEYGFDLSPFEDRIVVIDCYSSRVGKESTEDIYLNFPFTVEDIMSAYEKAIEKLGNERTVIVMSAISDFMDIFGNEKGLELIVKWMECGNVNKIGLFGNVEWVENGVPLERFNSVIKLGLVNLKYIPIEYFQVLKVDWTELQKKKVFYKIVKGVGVKPFIPKILVTGPYNAGKSSYIYTASRRSVSVDRSGSTIALDYGQVELDDMEVDIFGTPGQERFDPILEQLGGSALGVVLILDSTDPDTFERAKEMLKKTRTYNLPCVIVANKQNLKGALTADEVNGKLNLEREVPIIPVSIAEGETPKKGQFCLLNREDVKKSLKILIDMIM